MSATLVSSEISGLKLLARGKVRDIYDLGDTGPGGPSAAPDKEMRSGGGKLLIVATDRLSAFDYILPTPIPEKGRVLTQMSAFWFQKTKRIIDNHLISADLTPIAKAMPAGVALPAASFDGRSMLVKKAKRLDVECVVRGYLAGSGWKDYLKTGAVCGHKLPAGLKEAQKLPQPIFTPSTKAEIGHDQNISIAEAAEIIGDAAAREVERASIALYNEAAKFLEGKGLMLADTKFEFGVLDGKVILIDEAITPDSSRIWEKKEYKIGTSPAGFDKQFVRDYLERIGWNKKPPVPTLPPEVVEGTSKRYLEALNRIAS